VREHLRPRLALQGRQAAEVGAVRVREHDALEVARDPAELPDRIQHLERVVGEERVHERQLAAALDEERADASARGAAEAVDAGRELPHDDTRLHGAKALSTPSSAGASSG
jgi:hypothetical protein